jgi:hypothetical protein
MQALNRCKPKKKKKKKNDEAERCKIRTTQNKYMTRTIPDTANETSKPQ